MTRHNPVSLSRFGITNSAKCSRVKTQGRNCSLQWVPNRAKRLALADLHFGKSWSLAELCDHLALAFEATVRGSSEEEPPQRWQGLGRLQRVTRWFVKHFVLATGWFPKDVPAPASVSPSSSVSFEDALSRLEKAAAAFDRKYYSRRATWGHHSMLGKMNGRTWRRFHSIHAAHHFSFFNAKKSVGQPLNTSSPSDH